MKLSFSSQLLLVDAPSQLRHKVTLAWSDVMIQTSYAVALRSEMRQTSLNRLTRVPL